MAIFVELTTDAFEDNLRRQSQRKRGSENRSGRAGRRVARRPTRGIEIKEDTYAMIKVIDASGRSVPLIDSSSPDGTTTGYSNFLLQSVSEQRMEKMQVVETFGDSYIFFFGESPRMVDVQATLLNTHDFNWRAEWWQNYNDTLRGTRLVENGARIYLFYDDIILEGYLLAASVQEQADAPYHMPLNLKMFVTNYSNISLVGNPNFPIRSSVVLPHDVSLTAGDAAASLISRYRDGGWDDASAGAFDDQVSSSQAASKGGSGNTVVQNPDGSTTRTTASQSGPFTTTTSSTSGGSGSGFSKSFTTSTNPPQNSVNPLARRVSDALREVPRSFAVSQDVWTYLFSDPNSAGIINNLILRAGKPIRGLISENLDEYVGLFEAAKSAVGTTEVDGIPSAVKGTIRSQEEVDDLWREAIQFLSCYGADINSPDSLISLGLGPNGLKVGVGGSSVSFNPLTDEGRKKGSDFFDTQVEQIGTAFEQFSRDPLGNVFGRPKGSTNNNQLHNKPKYTEGAGDPLYGYPSDFAEGQPGFGISGFGDFGGASFGSALGPSGDPGFKDPSKFTFAGVAGEQGAFERFTAPREDSTSITKGFSLGSGGLSGGAGVAVTGKVSAFALISVPGLLDSTGDARSQAESVAEKQAQQKFGFANDNPFGVTCPKPDGGPLNYSDSFVLP